MKTSHDVSADTAERTGGSIDAAHDASVSIASPAPASAAQSVAVSGEITNRWNLPDNANPGTTLLGVGSFPPRRDVTPLGTTVFVSPVTVAAIARAKRQAERGGHEDDTLVEHDGPMIDGYQVHHLRNEPENHNRDLVRVDHNVALERTDRPRGLVRRDTRNEGLVRQKMDTEIMERPSDHPEKWRQFEELGLAPHPITRRAQKLVVSTYRLLGFAILTIIVAVLVGYIATTSFYFVNRTWVAPVAVSAGDEKVVTLKTQLASAMNEREKLVHELDQSERLIKAEQSFQLQFAKAIQRDAAERRVALARVQSLASSAAATRRQIQAANGEYSQQSSDTMAKEYEVGLINRDTMMAGKYQLAQIQGANLALAERQAEFDQRAAELKAQTSGLDSLLAEKGGGSALSYDVLKIARDYEASKIELERETGNRERLKAAIQRQDGIIEGLAGSAYLRALDNGATVALVPYENLVNADKGTPLYACRLSMVWCRQVGEVLDVLPGEITIKHPKRDAMVRGRMIEMKMSEPEAAYKEVLFLGDKPLKI